MDLSVLWRPRLIVYRNKLFRKSQLLRNCSRIFVKRNVSNESHKYWSCHNIAAKILSGPRKLLSSDLILRSRKHSLMFSPLSPVLPLSVHLRQPLHDSSNPGTMQQPPPVTRYALETRWLQQIIKKWPNITFLALTLPLLWPWRDSITNEKLCKGSTPRLRLVMRPSLWITCLAATETGARARSCSGKR